MSQEGGKKGASIRKSWEAQATMVPRDHEIRKESEEGERGAGGGGFSKGGI